MLSNFISLHYFKVYQRTVVLLFGFEIIIPSFLVLLTSLFLSLQRRLVSGNFFVHETLGHYKTVDELWDGET